MQIIADILLGAGALGAAFYCMVLSYRLKKFTRLENGMGGAIAVLSSQVDQMTKVLEAAQVAARSSADTLEDKTRRGEKVAERLELILAAMHDLPSAGAQTKTVKRKASTKSKPKADDAIAAWAADRVADKVAGSDPADDDLGDDAGAAPRARFVRRRVSRSDGEAA